jgi:hypothetical protein
MAKIVGIGANVFDTLYTLDKLPKEDTKMRANAVKVSGGGPCATGLVAASKLGESCAFIGNLSDDNGGKFLTVSLGIFSVVRIVRPDQLLVQASECCIPEKECCPVEEDDPCHVFRCMPFPTSEFCPASTPAPHHHGERSGRCGCGS